MLGLAKSSLNLNALGLGLVQTVYQSLVFQDIAHGVGKLFKQLFLIASQLNLKTLFLLEKLRFSTLELWLFEVDCDREKLTFEATLGHCEVDVCDQGLSIWWDINKLVPGGQIQLECWIVINCFIADLNNLTRSLLIKILSKNREEERFDAINLLDDEHFSKSDGQLKCGIEFLILVVENLQALFALLEGLLEPLSCRGGRVDY